MRILVAASLLAGAIYGQAARAACNRECLEGFVNQYLEAMVARNPFGLPLASRYTENGVTLEPGDLMWVPAIKIGNYKLEKATGKFTPFDKDCQRIENGVVTSNDPKSANEIRRMNCGDQFATGFSKIITRVQDRRFPVVDEERGLVYALIRFDHNGRNKTTVWNDGQQHPVNTPFDEPFSFMIGELFKIKDGKIRQIEALVLNVPYGMATGWGK